MASKLVVDRSKQSESVLAIGDAQGAELARAVPSASAELRQVVLAALAEVRDANGAMKRADDANERELADDDPPRRARDAQCLIVRELLIATREGIEGVYGLATAKACGFDGTIPTDPTAIERLSRAVMAALETVRFPEARLTGARIDAAEARSKLLGPTDALRDALKAVSREVREAQVTQKDKDRAIDGFDRKLRGVALLLQGLLVLAGEDELADRVRPTQRAGAKTTSGEEPNPAT